MYTMLAGGIWPRQRLFDSDYSESPTCPRCHRAAETEFHKYWECADNNNIDNIDVQRTQHLCGTISAIKVDDQGVATGGRVIKGGKAYEGYKENPSFELFFSPLFELTFLLVLRILLSPVKPC